jgi:hypothetical protein
MMKISLKKAKKMKKNRNLPAKISRKMKGSLTSQ